MGLPPGNRFLNSKERKKLLQALNEEFGIEELPEGVFVQNSKDRVMLMTRRIDDIPFEKLFIDSLGLYIGAWHADGFRFSIEGAQVFAPFAKKNVVSISDEQRVLWLKGHDLSWEGTSNDFLIVKHGNDVMGCGKIRQPREGKDEPCLLLNYVPKARRLVVINE